MTIFHRSFEMAAAAEQGHATRDARIVAHGVGIGGNAGIEIGLQTLELLVQDEVDHARHGVGAIDGRSAAGDDIHPLDQHLRQGVDVHCAIVVRRGDAMAVQQHEGALGAEIAQVQRVARVVMAAVAGTANARRTLEDRQLVQAVGDVGGGGGLQVVGRDDGQRRGRIGGVGNDARTGDDDVFHAVGMRSVVPAPHSAVQQRQRRMQANT